MKRFLEVTAYPPVLQSFTVDDPGTRRGDHMCLGVTLLPTESSPPSGCQVERFCKGRVRNGVHLAHPLTFCVPGGRILPLVTLSHGFSLTSG